MVQQAKRTTEERFNELKENYNHIQWNDANFLFKETQKLELTDLALASRLMFRVKHLSATSENQQRHADMLKRLENLGTSEVDKQHKQLEKTSVFTTIKDKFWDQKRKKIRQPLILFVLVPFAFFAIYQILLASPRFESHAQLIVKEPDGMATLDPAMAVVSGFGIASTGSDTELVKAFIHSSDMLTYLEGKLSISEHFSDDTFDLFSRLGSDASIETRLSYFQERVTIEINEKSQIIKVSVQGFTPEFAHELSEEIVDGAEWYINEIGRNLAKQQLSFVETEHELVKTRLREAKSRLLSFQRSYDLLDPEAEGVALQQITYQLEAEIALSKTELRALRGSMSEDAPLIMQAKARLDSLVQQLESERSRLTSEKAERTKDSSNTHDMGVGEILAKYSDYKIDLELALQGYTSSLVSLEKSRIEAYRQLKYLVVVEAPTLPEDATYPKVIYNLTLFLALSLMLFGIGKIILATVEELR